jgi:hypothetical protein
MQKRCTWSQEEIDFLQSNVGEYPFASVIRRYNQAALKRGWPKRTWHSIRWKCEHLRLSRAVSDSSVIKLADARRILGWSGFFCDQLIKKPELNHILKPFKEYSWYIERKRLARLALSHPELFYGISQDKLYFVIEDMDVVNSIKDSLSRAKKSPYTIKCIETGEEWDNALTAAEYFNVSRYTIQHSINEKRPVACLNLTFERLRPIPSKLKKQPRNAHD